MKVRHIQLQQRDVLDPSLEAELTAKFGLFEYLFKMPKAVPPDSWLVHNSVKPPAPADDERLGTRGFRAWLQPTGSRGLEVCDCPGPANLDDTFAWKSLMREDLSFVDFVDRFIRVENPVTGRLDPMVLYPQQRVWAQATFEDRDARGLRRYRRSVFSHVKKSGKTALGRPRRSTCCCSTPSRKPGGLFHCVGSRPSEIGVSRGGFDGQAVAGAFAVA